MIIGMMRKILFIRAAITPIELLLRRNPFIVLLTTQQAFAPLRIFAPSREIKIFKPLKLLYG
jgi:hypothetical protein